MTPDARTIIEHAAKAFGVCPRDAIRRSSVSRPRKAFYARLLAFHLLLKHGMNKVEAGQVVNRGKIWAVYQAEIKFQDCMVYHRGFKEVAQPVIEYFEKAK